MHHSEFWLVGPPGAPLPARLLHCLFVTPSVITEPMEGFSSLIDSHRLLDHLP